MTLTPITVVLFFLPLIVIVLLNLFDSVRLRRVFSIKEDSQTRNTSRDIASSVQPEISSPDSAANPGIVKADPDLFSNAIRPAYGKSETKNLADSRISQKV